MDYSMTTQFWLMVLNALYSAISVKKNGFTSWAIGDVVIVAEGLH